MASSPDAVTEYKDEISRLQALLVSKKADLSKERLKTHDKDIKAFGAALDSDFHYKIDEDDNTLKFISDRQHYSVVSRKVGTTDVFHFLETRGQRWCATYEIYCELKDLQVYISYIRVALFDLTFSDKKFMVPGIKVISTEKSTRGN